MPNPITPTYLLIRFFERRHNLSLSQIVSHIKLSTIPRPKVILFIRELSGLTQEELGNKISLSRSAISKHENDKRVMNAYSARKFNNLAKEILEVNKLW